MTTENAVAVRSDVNSLMTVIERAAINPDVDVDKMQALLDMQIKIMSHQAMIEYRQAMALVRAELKPVVRNKANTQTNSKYADLEAIQKAVNPILQKHGFYDTYRDDFPAPDRVGTTCILTHIGGHSEENRVEFSYDSAGIKGTVNKTALHAAASSMTYGQRISLCRALGIQITHDADGSDTKGSITTEMAADIDNRINALKDGKDYKPKFLSYMKVENIQDIQVRDYLKANNALKAKEKANAGS